MANRQLPDFLTVENELDGQELAYIAQNGKTRKSTLQKIKEFIIGTVAMGTTATNVTGAVKEINDKVGEIDVENNGDVATQLKEIMNNKYCKAKVASNILCAENIRTTINFDTKIYDTNSFIGSDKTKFICKTKGVYLITTAIEFETNASGFRGFDIMKTGSKIDSIAVPIISNNSTQAIKTTLVEMAIDDYISIQGFQYYSSTSLNIISGNISIVKVG